MLETSPDAPETSSSVALERYLATTLHDPVRVTPQAFAEKLPAFLDRMYTLGEGLVAGRRCVFLVTVHEAATPADIAKHVAMVRSAVDAIVVFVTPSLSAHNRSRLVGRGVPFVVPGRQLYIPDLAMDLRERFRTRPRRGVNGLSPAAQAVLFHHLLRPDEGATTPSLIAARLRYSAMSIGRAFDVLVDAGLAQTEKRGKERHIRFKEEGRHLMDAAHDLLRNPVRAEKFVREGRALESLKHAGESALAELTDLSPPRLSTRAVASRDWKSVAQTCGLVVTGRDEATGIVETWTYDPAGLSDTCTVDPLSLYAQFRDHPDERVAMAADRLLDGLAW